jgi:hypothetical protein
MSEEKRLQGSTKYQPVTTTSLRIKNVANTFILVIARALNFNKEKNN